MADDPTPRRGSGPGERDDDAAAPDPASAPTPSRAWEDDDEPTVVRKGFDFSRYQGEGDAAPAALAAGAGRHARGNGPEDTHSLRRSMLLTVASAVVPGSGLLGAPRTAARIVGAITTSVALAGGALLAWYVIRNPGDAAAMAGDTDFLRSATLALATVALVWVLLITVTHLATRPHNMTLGRRLIGATLVAALSFGVAAPIAVASRYSRDQTILVTKVFKGGEEEVKSTSRPTLAEEGDPWADIPRLNILLLGADSSEGREEAVEEFGIRTDTIIVASIDTQSGHTTLVQIPRNVKFTPFPPGTEMRRAYPDGFRGEPQANFWINSVWRTAEMDHPELFSDVTFPGAEALKQGVQGITGLKMDYFAMLNIDGLRQLIDAMGGVTVNINQRLAIGGSESGRRPSGYLEIGPDQHLDGYHAMWYARSRLGYSDYDRMARQSCLINAVIKQANPTNLLTRFEAIASASGDLLVTDIPQRDLADVIKLAFRVKDADVSRLVFSQGYNGYWYEDPDFATMRRAVQDAIDPPPPPPSASPSGSEAPEESPSPSQSESSSPSPSPVLGDGSQDVTDACAYNAG